MPLPVRRVLSAALLPALLALGPRAGEAAPAEQSTSLGNGLTAVVRSVPALTGPGAAASPSTGPLVGIVLLLRVGEHHDPEGKSGLAHLAEHCFVTCAAGAVPARTYEQVLAHYPGGHTAQTADLQSVFGMVVPAADLEAELRDLAARLGGLQVTAEDLAREQPRVLAEVAGMFDRAPRLAAQNRARERALPNPAGGRRAGLPAHVQALTKEDVQGFLDKHYRPSNAVLALAGTVDGATTLTLVQKAFGALPPGTPPVRRTCPAVPRPQPIDVLDLKDAPPGSAGQVTLAYPAPAPTSEDYAAFLVLAARLADRKAPPGGPLPLVFAPLDDPSVLYVSAGLEPGQAPEDAVAALQRDVSARLTEPFSQADVLKATTTWGLYTGLLPVSDAVAAQNPYLAALTLAFRGAHGLDPAALRRRLLDLRGAALPPLAARLFDPLAAGAAVVRVP